MMFFVLFFCSILVGKCIDLNNCTGSLRVCRDNEDEFLNNNRVCFANKLKSNTVRLWSLNWESGLYSSWIVQIVLSEILQIPTAATDTAGGAMDYYYVKGGWEEQGDDVIMNSAGNPAKSLTNAATDPFCNITTLVTDKASEPNAHGCSHICVENWVSSEQRLSQYPETANAGQLGVNTRIGWYITSYTLNLYPAFVSYRGLKDGASLQTIFKRPITVGERCNKTNNYNDSNNAFCDFLNANFDCSSKSSTSVCSNYLVTNSQLVQMIANNHTISIPLSISNSTYAYVATFVPDHVDLFGKPAGFFASPPCDWQDYDRWQALQGAKGIWPFYFKGDGDILDAWYSAVEKNEAFMFYDWTPNTPESKSLVNGPRYSLDRVSLVAWSRECENNRILYDENCLAYQEGIAYTNYNTTNNGCDYEELLLWKSVPISFSKTYPDAFDFISSFYLSNDIDLKLIAQINFDEAYAKMYPSMGLRRQHAVCEWISNNEDLWMKWIPKAFQGEVNRCLNSCSGHGVCVVSKDGNPVGDCKCNINFAGDDCSIPIATSLMSLSTSIFFFIFSGLGASLCIVSLVWIYIFRNTQLMKSATPSFMMASCVGGIIGNAGSFVRIFQGLQVTEGATCGGGEAMYALCYSIILSSLAVKTNRVLKIFKSEFAPVQHNLFGMFMTVSLIALVDVVLFAFWFIYTKPHLVLESTILSNRVVCESGNSIIWICSVTFLPKVILLVKNVEQAFGIREHVIIKAYDESTPLLLVVANYVVCVVLFLPLIIFINDAATNLMIELIGTIWTINFTVVSIIGHKLLFVLKNGYTFNLDEELNASDRSGGSRRMSTTNHSSVTNASNIEEKYNILNEKYKNVVKKYDDVVLEIKKLKGPKSNSDNRIAPE